MSVNRRRDKENMAHTQEYYSAIKKNETMPFTATQMDPETIIPSKASQIKTNTIQHCLRGDFKTMVQTNPPTKQKQTHRPRKQTH